MFRLLLRATSVPTGDFALSYLPFSSISLFPLLFASCSVFLVLFLFVVVVVLVVFVVSPANLTVAESPPRAR